MICLSALLVCQVALAAESKRVMILHSFGREFKPWNEYARTIRTELERQSPWPLDVTDQSVTTRAQAMKTPRRLLSSTFAPSMPRNRST